MSALALPGHAKINITGYFPATNDRYSHDPSFIAAGFDLSSITIADENPGLNTSDTDGRWLTMVRPKVFLFGKLRQRD
jgi:hypothetical protein